MTSDARIQRRRALAVRAIGGITFAAAGLFGLSFAYVGGFVGVVIGGAAALMGLGACVLSFRFASKQEAKADLAVKTRRELSFFELAEKRGGVLTVTDVSRAFQISAQEADAELMA